MHPEKYGPGVGTSREIHKKIILLVLVILSFTLGLVFLYTPMAPIKNGISADFWRHACGVRIEGKEVNGEYGDYWMHSDNRYIYYVEGFHGVSLYQVSKSEVIKDYSKVLKVIASRNPAPPQKLLWAEEALSKGAVDMNDPEPLLSFVRKKRLAYGEDTLALQRKWTRGQLYLLNFLFEFFYFAFLAIFAFLPWLTRKHSWGWPFHLGTLPMLIMLPHYLGYCSLTFTSVGPSEGILYPWFITWLKVPFWTELDSWSLQMMPKILEPISQAPALMTSISGGGGLGPLSASLIGLCIGLTVLGVRMRRFRHSVGDSVAGGDRNEVRDID